MDLNLPPWQRALWTFLWAFSAGFAVVTIIIDRARGKS